MNERATATIEDTRRVSEGMPIVALEAPTGTVSTAEVDLAGTALPAEVGACENGASAGVIQIDEHWRISEDGDVQWILQRERPKAKDDRSKWASLAFCGTLQGLLEVALPHRGVEPTDAASIVLQRVPALYKPSALVRAAETMLAEADSSSMDRRAA